jgi:hypothetical protein
VAATLREKWIAEIELVLDRGGRSIRTDRKQAKQSTFLSEEGQASHNHECLISREPYNEGSQNEQCQEVQIGIERYK